MLDRKLNNLKNEYKTYRFERLELLTKINDLATNTRIDAIQYLIKERIKLKIQKQDPIINLDTVNIKLLEAEIYALKSSFNTLDMKVEAILHESFSDTDCTSLQHLQFHLTDPHSYFAMLEHELT